MSHLEHKEASPRSVNCAIITISDSRTEETDESGKLFKEQLSWNGHKILAYALLKNDAPAIEQKINELLKMEGLQVIITSGGTGLSHRDVTVETVTPMLEKRLDGFGELFRYLSYQEIGTSSIMSRAVAGVISGKIILSLPGSLGATKLAIEKIILPEIGHLVREATR
ncbi:MAG: molybdenum cofactor biosynthesis protein MoaB [Chloroflexi bacterium]|nr:molybdenum cofactor biosynthesis protein MoaB [Chloroflexota bacterium]